MTAPQFLSSLQSRGVQLVPDASAASGVRVRAPRGVVTGPVLEKIRAALPTLLPLIEDRAAPASPSEGEDISLPRVWTLDDDLTAHPCYVKRPGRFDGTSRWDGEAGKAAGEWLQSLTDAQRGLLFLIETRDVPKPPDWSEEDEAIHCGMWSAELTRWARLAEKELVTR